MATHNLDSMIMDVEVEKTLEKRIRIKFLAIAGGNGPEWILGKSLFQTLRQKINQFGEKELHEVVLDVTDDGKEFIKWCADRGISMVEKKNQFNGWSYKFIGSEEALKNLIREWWWSADPETDEETLKEVKPHTCYACVHGHCTLHEGPCGDCAAEDAAAMDAQWPEGSEPGQNPGASR